MILGGFEGIIFGTARTVRIPARGDPAHAASFDRLRTRVMNGAPDEVERRRRSKVEAVRRFLKEDRETCLLLRQHTSWDRSIESVEFCRSC